MSDNLFDVLDANRRQGAATSAYNAALNNPDEAARAQAVAARLGLPAATVQRNPVEVQRREAATAAQNAHPAVQDWLAADQGNADVAHHQIGALSDFAGLLNRVQDDVLGGLNRAVGSTIQGVGSLGDAIDQKVYGKPGGSRAGAIGLAAPFMRAGKAQAGRVTNPNIVDQGLEMLGGLIPMIGPQAGMVAPAMFGLQGADQSAAAAQAKGASADQTANAVLGNTGAQVAIGTIPIAHLAEAAMPALKNAVMGGVAKYLAGTAAAGVQGAAMSIAGNAAEKATFDPTKPLVDPETGKSGAMMAALHFLVRAPGVVGEIRSRAQTGNAGATAATAFNAAADTLNASGMAQRAPERVQALIQSIAPDASVHVPAAAVRRYLQPADGSDMPSPDAVEAFHRAGVADQVEASLTGGHDVVIPAAAYLTHIAPTEGHAALAEHLRVEGQPSIRDGLDAAAGGEEDMRATVERVVKDANDAAKQAEPTQRVFQDMVGKFRAAGHSLDVSRNNAAILAAHMETFGKLTGRDAWEESQQLPLDVRREFPAELQSAFDRGITPFLDALRKGKKAGGDQGPSLLEWMAKRGGVKDANGDFTAIDAHLWHKENRGRGRLVSDKGRTPEDMAELAQEAGYIGDQASFGQLDSVDRRASPADLHEAVAEELAGRKRFATPPDGRGEYFNSAVDQLGSELDRLGVRPDAPDAEIADALKRASTNEDGSRYEQSAYHGSPHVFDKFSLDKIGSGEGAQVYGHGLYFAGRKEIAQHYRRSLSRKHIVFGDGSAVELDRLRGGREIAETGRDFTSQLRKAGFTDLNVSAAFDGHEHLSDIGEIIASGFHDSGRSAPLAVAKWLRSNGPRRRTELEFQRVDPREAVDVEKEYDRAGRMLQKLVKDGLSINHGRLYHVDIPEDHEFLNWDKPITDQQGASILKALDGLTNWHSTELAQKIRNHVTMTGRQVYKTMQTAFGAERSKFDERGFSEAFGRTDALVSQVLKKEGIAGIRYLDAGSRSDGEGHHNYVVFDDSRIEIKHYEQQARGDITFSPEFSPLDARATIRLFQSSNLSTPVHEMGHYFLERLKRTADAADAPDAVKALWNDAARWLDHDGSEAGLSTEQHEQWARGIEAYMLEGKAPNEGLRGVFRVVRSWMLSIYREVRALNVNLTPEIRDVFDRLLASEDEIARGRESQGLNPVGDAETLGMTKAESAAYTKAIDDGNEQASSDLFQKLYAAIRREKTKAWAEEKAALRPDVEREVDARPVVRAYHLLTKGELLGSEAQPGRVQLSSADVVDSYGTEAVLDRLPRTPVGEKGIVTREGGLHPDEVAELTGHRSGEAMLDAVMALEDLRRQRADAGDRRPVRKALVDDEVQRLMLEKHGDVLHDGTIEQEALDALHSDGRMKLIAIEERALGKRAGDGSPQWTVEQLNDYAQRVVGDTKVSVLRPDVHLRAERTNGVEARRLLLKGDAVGALERIRQQRINAHLFRAAREATREVGRINGLFDRIVKAKVDSASKNRNFDMVQAARAMLASHGIGRADQDPMAYLEKVRDYDPEAYADMESNLLAAIGDKTPTTEMTVDQLGGLKDVVEQMWLLSRSAKVVEIDGKRVALEEVSDALVSRLNDLGAPDPEAITRAATPGEKWMRRMSGARAALRRVEHWARYLDGGGKGAFRTFIWNPISEAADRYRADRVTYTARFLELVKDVPALRKGKIEAPELDYTFGHDQGGVGKAELLHALLHTGNESNKRKLLLGRGWAKEDADGNMDTSRWDAFATRMHDQGVLTKADYDFAQGVWNLLDSMKPAAQKAHRSVYGRYFNEVTANAFETPFGRYDGGYVPAITDPFHVQDSALRAEAEAIEAGNDVSMFPAPNRGFTKGRVENYTKPLELNLGLLPQHIDKVLKFTHMAAPVKDVLRVMKQGDFSRKLSAFDPVAQSDLLLPWLNRSARQIVETPTKGAAGKAADDFWRAVRTRTGMNIMVGNVSNALQQLTGFSISATRVPAPKLMGSLYHYMRDPGGMAEAVEALSPFMASRGVHSVHEIRSNLDTLLLDPTKYQKAREFAQKHAYVMQAMTQNVVDTVTWKAAHEHALERGESEVEAVRTADSAVRETQGSMTAEDISRFETGTPIMRAFTQFYSYFNGQANLLGSEFGTILRDAGWKHGLGRGAYVYVMGMAIPAIMATVISKTLNWDFDGEDGYLKDFMDVFVGSQFRYATGMTPLVGPAVNVAVNRFDDKQFNDRLSISPGVSIAEASAGTPFDLYHLATTGKGEKRAVKDTLSLLALMTGIPLGLAARPAGYLADVHEGKVQPMNTADLVRGLVTGTASAPSRVH